MFAPTKDIAFPLVGGLDLVSSQLQMKPGKMIFCDNLEIIGGTTGYSVPSGYERCTNDTLPSETAFFVFEISNITTDIAIGDEFTSSGKTVKSLDVLTSPQDGDYLVVASNDSDFTTGHTWTKSGNAFDLDSVVTDTSDYTTAELQAYHAQAIEQTRTAIPEITGSGDVLGGFRLKGHNYTFRGGSLYRGIDYDWEEITMPDVMYFDEGVQTIVVGSVLTDGVETGQVTSVTTQSGAYDITLAEADQGEGYITLENASGAFTVDAGLYVDGETVTAFTNGLFTTDTGWTKGTGWDINTTTAGMAHSDGSQTADSDLEQAYAASSGDYIQVTMIIDNYSAGSVSFKFGTDESDSFSADGTHVATILLTADVTTFAVVADSDFIGDIDSVVSAVGRRAKVYSVNETYVLPTTGKYKTKNYNFTNLVDNESTFGVCGTSSAFEFDGSNYIPIFHPDAVQDEPFWLDIHQERLQLFFGGGELAYSVSGSPRVFNAILGSGSWSTGSELTGSRVIHGNAQIIYTREDSWFLIGDGIYSSELATRAWQFYRSSEDIGAIQWSISGHGYPVYMSFAGLYQLMSTDASGGYFSREIAELIQPFLEDNKNNVVGSLWARDKSQYRVFFSTGQAVYVSFYRGKVAGATVITIPDGVTNVWSEVENENEYLFFTSDDGYLYRMDSGYTFDTHSRTGGLRLPFYNYGQSRIEKLFGQMIIEFDSPIVFTGDTEITYTINCNYGSPDSPRPLSQTESDVLGRGGVYGSNDGYGFFVWSGPIVSEIEAYLDGYGANMSILITYDTKYDSSFTLMTAIVDYIELGRKGQS